MRPTLSSQPWLTAAVLMVPLARETTGWLIPPTWSSARITCSWFMDVQHGRPLRPPALDRRARAQPALRNTALNANHDDNSEAAGGGDDNAAAGGAGGGASKAGAASAAAAAASAAPQHVNTKGKQERVKAAEDSGAPIFYIKGLKEGGGVGVWGGDNGDSNSDDDSAGGDVSRARGGGNAAMMARALRNAEREIEGGGNYEEGVEDGGEVENPAAGGTPVWEKVQAALGLGVWSYAGLGLAVFIIALNNVLGVGWAAKLIDPDYEPDSVLNVQEQGRQIQYMPLDDTSNLLSD